ncbi:MAG: hypothetical protein OHK005_16220 [Candidatus Methylacidiphilales bacterium]
MIWIASALIVLVVLFRVIAGTQEGVMNFAPVMALAFCGGIYLRGVYRWLIPLGALFMSDLILNYHHGVGWIEPFMVATYACYAVAVAVGMWIGDRKSFGSILGGVFGNALLFYLVTNTVAWWANPGYVKTLAGWVQALTVGIPGLPPTYLFFRNSLLSDLVFTVGFVLCMELSARMSGRPSLFPRQEPESIQI